MFNLFIAPYSDHMKKYGFRYIVYKRRNYSDCLGIYAPKVLHIEKFKHVS